MTTITAADGVLLLLREQLERRARSKPGDSVTAPRATTARERIAALAAARTLSDEELGRATVRSLLSERLGAAIAVEPGFELAVRDVARLIAETPEGAALLAATRRQLLGD